MAGCKIDGCQRPSGLPGSAQGMCRSHYRRWQRYGDPTAPLRKLYSHGGVECSKAACIKPARTLGLCHRHYAEFRRLTDPGHIREKSRAAAKRVSAWKQKQKEEFAGRQMPTGCEVCGNQENGRKLNFDHCHSSHLFRGWLCGRCNRTLGIVADNPMLLRQLADYLDRFERSRKGKMGDPNVIAWLLDNAGRSGWDKERKVKADSQEILAVN